MRKKLFISIILIFALTQISAAQTQEVKPPIDENTPKEVKEYYQLLLKWKDMSRKEAIKEIGNLSDKELKYIASLIYKTLDHNYEKFQEYYLKQGVIYHSDILMKIREKFSPKDYVLIYLPYYLIIKITEVNETKTYMREEEKTLPNPIIVEVKCIVKQTLKGRFSKGEQITFLYNKNWPYAPKFSIDEEALVILWTRSFGYDPYDYHLGLAVGIGSYTNKSKYPISNNIIFDQNNFFGYGKEVSIEKFEKSFQNDVNKIKNLE